MQIKAQPPIHFLYARFETTISQMMEKATPIMPQLLQEVVDHHMQLCGPVYWNYFGFSGNESLPFTLEVALPVALAEKTYEGKFDLRLTEPFKCVEAIHEGPWDQIPATYAKMMHFIGEHQLMPTFENREVYLNADFQHPEANITIIRMGIN